MQKLVFIDVETTGVNPERNGLIQISGCVQIGNQIMESFDYFVRPFPSDEIEEQALQVTGIDCRQLLPPGSPGFLQVPGQEFYDPHDIYARLQVMFGRYVDQYDKTDKFQFVGYNSHSFDMPFLRSFWQKNGDRFFGSWFWYPCLDVMLIWAQLLQSKRPQLADFKLATLARHCQIDVDDKRLHDSQYDIELTRQLLLKACDIINLTRFESTDGIQGELF